MSESLLTALVGLILGPSGVIALLIAWRGRQREEPIKQRDADVAVAHTLQGMGVSIAEGLRTDITRMQGDITTLQAQVRDAKKDAQEARADAREAREEAREAREDAREAREKEAVTRHENSTLWEWVYDMIDHWSARRLLEVAPPAPTMKTRKDPTA